MFVPRVTDVLVSMFSVNTSDLDGVTQPFSLSPDENVAKTTGDHNRYPGRLCHYDNDVGGECLPNLNCSEEEQEASGYNSPWMCPQRTDTERGDRICCPFLGKGKLGQAVEVAGGGGDSKRLC